MIRVAITGNMGSGKSEVLRLLKQDQNLVFEADQVAKKLLLKGSPVYSELRTHFKSNHLLDNGDFDTKSLAREVFSNKKKLKILESILHPEVWRNWEEFIKKKRSKLYPFVFFEIPLFKSGFSKEQFDFIVLVKSSDALKLKYLSHKGITKPEAEMRWKNQIPDLDFLSSAHFIIENESDLNSLKTKVDDLLLFLKKNVKK